jgi:acyl-CoA synthetase (AMP-forming)/AMP-acid ligase II
MCITDKDTVFAPLPLFHINPLGYGVIGGLLAGANILVAERFSATTFWESVKANGVTALILHSPPIEILKRRTTSLSATGHDVRVAFAADPSFLEMFNIPLGVSAYGSTEAGGLSHMWKWRQEDQAAVSEGATHYAGVGRYDMSWRVAENGEILVRDRGGRALFAGYRRSGSLEVARDGEGWFHSGDMGRVDVWGNLVFIERLSESVRVKGEYVPLTFVEEKLSSVSGLGDFALWRQPDPVAGHEVVLYVAGPVPTAGIKEVSQRLPAFMRPVRAFRVAEIPRDSGVGKVRRRLLEELVPLEVVEL